MNPFKTRIGTVIVGFAMAAIAIVVFGLADKLNLLAILAWVHVTVGIAWVGILYYFNFVQIPAVGEALTDEGGPGPAAINKYVAPRALFWFRWAAIATWVTGLAALESLHATSGSGIVAAFTFQSGFALIGMGAWLGTIMLINVWMIIWPNQRRILGLNTTPSSADEIAKAKGKALFASRLNVALSVPMLLAMTGQMHGLMV